MVTEKSCNLSEYLPQDHKQTSPNNKDAEPVGPVQMNIYQCNIYRKDLSWVNFNNELKDQEKQQVKDQQSSISAFVAYPTIPSSN